MGFDDGRIVLDSSNNAYYTGQTIRGHLIFDQNKVKTFRGIYVKFVGFCKVYWTTTETRRVDDKDETYTVEHESYEEYCRVKQYLVGGESGEHHLQPGHYDFPFTFEVPGNCPSSYEGEYAHVRYEIKIVVDKAFKFDQRKVVGIRVMAPLDLNHNPYCKEPLEIELTDTYCCCCFSSGSSETVVNAPLSGYCPGQSMTLDVTTSNKGNVEIDEIKLRIKKKLVFIAEREPDTREERYTLAEIKKGPIPGNTSRNWSVEMEIPDVDAYNFAGCSYITLTYKFEVVVSPEGCHSDAHKSHHIIIGTIPLVGYQDDVANPLSDQMPQQVSAITQQPSFSATTGPYPNNPPYPVTPPQMNPTAPYPTNDSMKSPYGANDTSNPPSYQPYPANEATKSPYPASNAPYPASNAAYPASNAPYPASNAPYPSANPPYPADSPGFIKPPYPSGNSPYVGGTPSIAINPPSNSPNPSVNPPYPNVTPFHDNPPPYPGKSVPFPSQMSPSQMGSMPTLGTNTLLKTGNVGFIVHGGSNADITPNPGATTPLLASPAPTNPYLAASAPSLDSPDIEKKE